MRIGLEGNHLAGVGQRGWRGSLDFAHEHGLDGVFFKSILDLSPTLDLGELREARAYADARGMYLEVGIGRINPYNTAESPNVRRLGGGDYRKAMEQMIRAGREIGCTELWAETATIKRDVAEGIFIVDRFRTDAPWEDQLAATTKFLALLAPLLRDLGCRVNIETHEDVTSYEVVRMVEAVGPDVVGITFDTANVLARGEDPVAAAQRVAPYTHTTHIKDAVLIFGEEGLFRQIRACGDGVVDWDTVIGILAGYKPDLNLSLEEMKSLMAVPIADPAWRAGHPDLAVAEVAELVRLAQGCEGRIARGEMLSSADYAAIPWDELAIPNMLKSQSHLRAILARRGLTHSPPGNGASGATG